jgi:hypothetical protein
LQWYLGRPTCGKLGFNLGTENERRGLAEETLQKGRPGVRNMARTLDQLQRLGNAFLLMLSMISGSPLLDLLLYLAS